jgi:Aldehyde dehydrogenase family
MAGYVTYASSCLEGENWDPPGIHPRGNGGHNLSRSDFIPEFPKYYSCQHAKLLRKWYNLCLENASGIAKILTWENGKPLAEAKGEVTYYMGAVSKSR